MNNYLKHYGVLGMKWGVRRYQNYDGSYTSAGRQRYYGVTEKTGGGVNTSNRGNEQEPETISNYDNKKKLTTKQKIAIGAAVTATAMVAIGGMYIYKKNKLNSSVNFARIRIGHKLDVSSLSDKETILKAGSAIQRISSKSVEDYRNEGARIYATYLKKDNKFYKYKLPSDIKSWYNKGLIDSNKAYVHNLKLKKDVCIASEKATALAYKKIHGVDEIDEGRYRQFMEGLVDKNNPNVTKFFNYLKQQGYDGMIDYNDKGWSKDPIIIFNPKSIIKSSKSHKLTSFERFISVLTY